MAPVLEPGPAPVDDPVEGGPVMGPGAGGQALAAGDGAAVSGEASVTLVGAPEGEALLFDLP